jgi:hypothetical protein
MTYLKNIALNKIMAKNVGQLSQVLLMELVLGLLRCWYSLDSMFVSFPEIRKNLTKLLRT